MNPEAGRKTLTPVTLPDGRVAMRKEWSGDDAGERLRREEAILERLAGVPGVPVVLEPCDGTCLLMADTVRAPAAGGRPIAVRDPTTGEELITGISPVVGPLLPDRLRELAIGLARILADVHERGVVHKNVNPGNIYKTGAGPFLVDFDLATTFAEERPGFTHQDEIAGALAYMAPEQTGRTGRPVDQRADLYSLGASLYEYASGRPPFQADTALQLIHDHLTTPPQPLESELWPIIAKLLEKEPDRRYQSAEGLRHDLLTRPAVLGERDFARRLSPPSRLIGREREVEELHRTFADAMAGRARGLLAAGAPGVGKTALIDELRPLVTQGGGWFVMGKFDQYRRDTEADAVRQAMRALARLLLAEPDRGLGARLRAALGPNAGLIAGALPEFAVLLGVEPTAETNEVEMGHRLQQAAVDILRAVASPVQPVVMVLDDLQWAGAFPIGVIDAILSDSTLHGVLVVGAYRDAEVGEAHPLAATQARWARRPDPPAVLRLENLAPADLTAFLAEMLRLEPARAADLAAAIGRHTGGNPYDTVELVNALRRERVLTLEASGWRWDPAAVRGHIGHAGVLDLVIARIEALPPGTRDALQTLACLGGEIDLATIEDDTQLVPALEDGLLVLDRQRAVIRFRHDRVQQAAYGMLTAERRRERHLRIARRIADPSIAAEQYLQAVDLLANPEEKARVAGLFRAAAGAIRLMNGTMAERFLLAARDLVPPGQAPDAQLLTDLHSTLYQLGRLPEADELYADLERRGTEPLELVDATCVQIYSLTNRHRSAEAVALGERLLARLGVARPADLGDTLGERLRELARWAAAVAQGRDDRPERRDPLHDGIGKILEKMLSPAFFCDRMAFIWVVLESHRRWVEHGPNVSLMAGLGRIPTVVIASAQDYRTAYDAARHVLAVGEARGYGAATGRVRYVFAGFVQPWFEPLEENVATLERAREEVLHTGDVQYACFAYDFSIAALLDCAPTLDAWSAEIAAGLALSERTRNEIGTIAYEPFAQLLRALRGEPRAADPDYSRQPVGLANFHVYRALEAAILGDDDALREHSATAMTMLGAIPGIYTTATAHLVRALALTRGDGDPEELDCVHAWLRRRAEESPGTFAHLAALIDAERSADLLSFQRALDLVPPQPRPWQRAYITERAALAHLAAGLTYSGRGMLAEARRLYAAWGAKAKVAALVAAHPFLAGGLPDKSGAGFFGHLVTSEELVTSEAIDLMAVLAASRALSSQTSLDRLRDQVAEVLSAMTGATAVRLLLWNPDARAWRLSTAAGDQTVDDAGVAGLLPVAAVRYADRVREPLVVADAVTDGRFARDPYFAGLATCSLMVLPVLVQGQPRAMLVLENRLSRGAFTADRLDAVDLIAGQLAVSLDNALLYASLERKVAERTEALEAANERLARLSVTDPLTGLANRRKFVDGLGEEWRRAARNGQSLAIAMIDIDHFKLYNDHFGHPGGDACLRLVASTLQRAVRGTDLVARLGGEEFAVVLPEAELATAGIAAERIRAAIEALSQPHPRTDAGVVTVSVGVAAARPSGGGDPEKLVEAADVALYEAKRGGRNRVEPGLRPPVPSGL
ncbi:diguanylate cyclase [Dactylosporangium vinaceum]|uniref:Diguanylate cyclase n=1 Tax=Dactylosporangium vinaceum TaxID=53362 RepID=A0ABV5MH30_9ACTN|nr:diguanylate cyclase [Dactylosporangium vinaceum]UAB94883.1 diguanylate cyclase [Dactylosporangium vinaceum]